MSNGKTMDTAARGVDDIEGVQWHPRGILPEGKAGGWGTEGLLGHDPGEKLACSTHL